MGLSLVGLALGWGVRRFHSNIYSGVYVFQPNILVIGGNEARPQYLQ